MCQAFWKANKTCFFPLQDEVSKFTWDRLWTKTFWPTHTPSKRKDWLAKPNMYYWPQQLKFALWSANSGCKVTWNIGRWWNSNVPLKEVTLQIPRLFHSNTYSLPNGRHSVNRCSPWRPTFNPIKNPFDVASFNRFWSEFEISPNTDFRLTHDHNHGLGSVFIWWNYQGPRANNAQYTGGGQKFFNKRCSADQESMIYIYGSLQNQAIHRGLCSLCSGASRERALENFGWRWKSKRSAERIPDSHRTRDKKTRLVWEQKFRHLADAFKYGNKQFQRCGLQQPA